MALTAEAGMRRLGTVVPSMWSLLGMRGPRSAQGSALGSARGSAQGSAQGSALGSARGSAQGSARGLTQGSVVLALLLVLGCFAGVGGVSCRWDPSGLTPPPLPDAAHPDGDLPDVAHTDASDTCGNGRLDPGEACDGALLAGETCVTQGYTGGTLACTTSCLFDYRGCEGAPVCGNGVREPGEPCDGADIGGATCLAFLGLPDGILTCTGDCALDGAGCHRCGDGFLQGPEECDPDVGGASCVSRGFTGGTLACGVDCRYDEGGCYLCGNGVCEVSAGERWDLCPADCGWDRLSAGATHSCGLRRDGSAWCWGANDQGQLGDGTVAPSLVPRQVLLGQRALDISAGGSYTCAVLADRTLACWGKNDKGQLGDGTVLFKTAPTPVPGLTDLRRVVAGGAHTCALSATGVSSCWGLNDKGQVGDATFVEKHSPVPVSTATGLTSAVSLTAGSKHTCAVASDQTAWCWGDKGTGRLGDGLNVDQNQPSPVSTATGLTVVEQISAGTTHTCAVSVGGQAYCWGSKATGRLGDDTNADQPIPALVVTTSGLASAIAITAGGAHTCALRADHAVFCWGENADGAVGDNTTTDRAVPTAVDNSTGLAPAIGLSAGTGHVLGWNGAGNAWGWGDGPLGQLGDGFAVDRRIPTPVSSN